MSRCYHQQKDISCAVYIITTKACKCVVALQAFLFPLIKQQAPSLQFPTGEIISNQLNKYEQK